MTRFLWGLIAGLIFGGTWGFVHGLDYELVEAEPVSVACNTGITTVTVGKGGRAYHTNVCSDER